MSVKIADEEKKVRVCFIINSYPPRIGGAERLVENLTSKLSTRGHSSIVITRKEKGTGIVEKMDNTTIIRVPVIGNRTLKALIFRVATSIILFTLRKKYDVIHAHSLDSPAVIASIVAPILRKSYFITVHNTGKVKAFLNRKEATIVSERINKTCSGIISINNEITDELLSSGMCKDKIIFIPNGVDIERFSPPSREEKQRIMQRLSLFDRLIFLFVGNFHSQKGIDTLLLAWEKFQRMVKEKSTVLLMIGDGNLMGMARELVNKLNIKDSVYILGRKLRTEKYYKVADCFVQPSRWEGLSIAMLEAMSSACAVITTPVGGAKEIILDGKNGLFAPVDDPEVLAEKMRLVFQDHHLRNRLQKEARKTAIESYSIDRCVERHIEVYSKFLKKEKGTHDNAEVEKDDSSTLECNEQIAGKDTERIPQTVS